MNSYENIRKILDDRKINYKIHLHDEIPTVEEAIKKIDFDLNSCLKTIAFEYCDKYFFVSLLAQHKLDYSKLCSGLNINRSNLKRANSDMLEKRYGYESGGIAPISLSDDIIVVFDKNVTNKNIVYCGSGCRNKTIEINIKDLLSLNNTVIIGVSKNS